MDPRTVSIGLIMEYNLASTGTEEQLVRQNQLLMLEEADCPT